MPKETHILCFFLILSFCCSACMQKPKPNLKKFNSQQWMSGDRIIRGSMVSNIIDDSILIDKSKSDVILLLGNQDDSTDNGITYTWNVDQDFIGNPWRFWLRVDFDSITDRANNVWTTD